MRVVYNSFTGRYSDNPRALYEALAGRPDLEHVWMADPAHAFGFPPGTTTVPVGGEQCVRALEAADVVVSNTHVEVDWTPAPGSVYLQTWHGTPLKRIHFDVLWAPEGRLDRLTEDVRRWDLLLSPNTASTGPLRGAFAYDGEVLETGYPRNDVLSAPDRDERREKVRGELGIAEGTTAVLYTPTWRDDEFFGGDGPVALHLDLDEFGRRLGEDHVLLLRLHYMVSERLGPVDRPDVQDVSHHPDISDLYLAADVLVTDYSSTMFDFAVTGKPLVFFAYDLEHYRDTLRGFYFDLFADAPGPLLRTSDEVLDALADLDAVRAGSAASYGRFRDTFCHLEDGHATQRVLERVFPVAS